MNLFELQTEKKALLDNLHYLKSLFVKEFTFRKKYDELQHKIEADREAVHRCVGRFWSPSNFQDEQLTIANIANIKPRVIIADDKKLLKLWGIARLYVSSGEYNQTPGRFIKFLVVDVNQGNTSTVGTFHESHNSWDLPWPVLGIGAVSNELTAITPRDEYIGWTKEQRDKGALNHTAIGSTIIATQPFGFNFNGGKLIAALITSEIIRNEWQLQTGNVLVGLTTTSLYGVPSMYDRLPWWKRVGLTKGLVTIQPKPELYKKWLAHIKEANAKEFTAIMTQAEGKKGPVTNYKGKVMKMIFDSAGIKSKQFNHNFERGVYFSSFYENTKEFLCGKSGESELKLKSLFQDDVSAIMAWWRPRAIKRYQELKAQGKLKPQKHFYNLLGYMDYQTAKENFLDDVGR